MSDARDLVNLEYILVSIQRLEEYTEGRQRRFEEVDLVQDAVMRRMETLSDAAHRLSPELKGRHPDVPWRSVYAFRNIAAHAYTEVDLKRVWRIVEGNLPKLKQMVEQELARGDPDRGLEG